MSAPDPKPIKDELKKTADDVKRHAGNISDEVRNQADEAGNELRERAERLKGRAGETYERVREKARETGRDLKACGCRGTDRVRDFIREKPMPALIGFTALGFALGYLLRSSCRDRSWCDDVQDEADSFFGPIGRKLRAGYEDLRSRGHDAYEAVNDRLPRHPVDTVVDRARAFAKNLSRR